MPTVPVTPGARAGARLLRTAFPLFGAAPREIQALAPAGGAPTQIQVPSRHGSVTCLVYRPPTADQLVPPPVYVHFHGGAFIVRAPEQDDHVCRFVADAAHAVVVSVNYDTAPAVRYPVAEHQAYDIAEWIRLHGKDFGWDSARLAVGGLSAGSKLAVNICQQARDAGTPLPVALVSGYGATDMTLPPGHRTSPAKHPAVAPWLIRLMYNTYFADPAARREPLASPALDDDLAGFPPTLVMTGTLDAMAPESDCFARRLAASGVAVTHESFPESDHGFTHGKPADVARRSLELIAAHLRTAYAAAPPRPDSD
ncbi:alpha/beta hydrolase fold domain-containing protein [Streptomyces sp. NBC_00370]|uniref:alpha/beta hydrolase fold domain-containing protein n=1 Tax=Streptomyces sp. NBC_00370 TaxID=2975728 RepID=UPI002E270D5E